MIAKYINYLLLCSYILLSVLYFILAYREENWFWVIIAILWSITAFFQWDIIKITKRIQKLDEQLYGRSNNE